MVAPTQGVISLAVLGILERSGIRAVLPDSADHIHLCVEATKQAFKLRDAYVTDPAYMTVAAESLLSTSRLDALAKEISLPTALPWSGAAKTGDTVWMGVNRCQRLGRIVHPEHLSRIWQRRRTADDRAQLAKSRRVVQFESKTPAGAAAAQEAVSHAEPAAARFKDGRSMVYGTIGRRRPTANAGRRLFACNLVRAAVAASRLRSSLAARPDLGTRQRYAQTRQAEFRRPRSPT